MDGQDAQDKSRGTRLATQKQRLEEWRLDEDFGGSRIMAARPGRDESGARPASGAHHGARDGDGALRTASIARVRTVRRIMVRDKNVEFFDALWCAVMRKKHSTRQLSFWLLTPSLAQCNVQQE